MNAIGKLLLSGAAVLLLPAASGAQEVFKEITSQRLEDILKSMNINHKKGTDKNINTVTFYDYKSKAGDMRLWNFSGKDLMVDVILPKADFQAINKWNGLAKFSRAHSEKNDKGEWTVLESNLDLAGGVTEETIKHFIRNMDVELAKWGTAAPAAVTEDLTTKNVTAARLEKILADLKIDFKKSAGRGKDVFFYDYERNNYKIRVTNFGGTDLMIDWQLPKAATLAKVNEWNVKRHYVRAVVYPGKGNPFTALESNLDCEVGISDSMIRYFIETFDLEVKAFDDHVK